MVLFRTNKGLDNNLLAQLEESDPLHQVQMICFNLAETFSYRLFL